MDRRRRTKYEDAAKRQGKTILKFPKVMYTGPVCGPKVVNRRIHAGQRNGDKILLVH